MGGWGRLIYILTQRSPQTDRMVYDASILLRYLNVVSIFLIKVFNVLPLEGLVFPVKLVEPSVFRRQLPLVVLGNLRKRHR